MKLLIKKQNQLSLPKNAYESDAGFDVIATSDPIIVGDCIENFLDGSKIYKTIKYIEYKTNLYIAPKPDLVSIDNLKDGEEITGSNNYINYHIEIFPRSSISNYNLILANSVATIDTGYRNEILLRYKYMSAPEDLVILPEGGVQKVYSRVNLDAIYHLGDKIGQVKPRVNINIEFVLVDELPSSQRNLGSFGSSGK